MFVVVVSANYCDYNYNTIIVSAEVQFVVVIVLQCAVVCRPWWSRGRVCQQRSWQCSAPASPWKMMPAWQPWRTWPLWRWRSACWEVGKLHHSHTVAFLTIIFYQFSFRILVCKTNIRHLSFSFIQTFQMIQWIWKWLPLSVCVCVEFRCNE